MRDKMKSKLEKFRLFSKLKSKTFWTYIKCCYKQENHFKFSTFLVSLYHLLEVFCATLSFFVFKKSPKQKRMKPKKHRITFESAGPPHLPFLKVSATSSPPCSSSSSSETGVSCRTLRFLIAFFLGDASICGSQDSSSF